MLINKLSSIVQLNKKSASPPYLRNLLKEALQGYVLNYVYSSRYGKSFIFKGGTALRFCFGLPRLSEDLDFDVANFNNLSISRFERDLTNYFVGSLQVKDFEFKLAGNKSQMYLKFPMLDRVGLNITPSDSNVLFVRIDLGPLDSKYYMKEISIKNIGDFNFIINRYSLADMCSSKIAAILQRTFRKDKGGLITFKGRDYYDLIWFMEQRVEPNLKRLKDITKISKTAEIQTLLDKNIQAIKSNYLKEDLLPFFTDSSFVENFANNFHKLYQNNRQLLGLMNK
ncbi:hypothetical protein COW99_05610 [Candidatus Roizmanbacteria bacterium CG22_combo_CG10-13_8_21_14_all_38_20]|uniref:Nucleotidyl transferase AbiEii/AbiGii toxin family protein n=1 Tax=Candidatus Roizmanbacteria bacterium CG22_combo_CG10-13_8_21_14_all_38_20 TaxID=1974862 RepID=A0A2H0BUC9_9BACT|nr:nucleotidyl transferase AbiEii/AbiGii toxin family protein [Candidatus Microgenomates bacterium]PIP61231.1 MAG: hypothetical protein COW99_05610 [Candidatus Roizmanbacteria bacterium CG22_combo_CG10-13_8_21_14_all_38_20]PJC31221.1 MAG: hypothetical protein CO050_04270 [Candidatus Roizmanbacteria bacterium CG_4_9_14_0_2_um_filter_38_17]